MPIYRINDEKIELIERTTFSQSGLRERQDLQQLLRARIEIITPDTLIVAEEFGEWEDSRRRIDLLGIDKNGNLVVIELKRTEDGGRHPKTKRFFCQAGEYFHFDEKTFVLTNQWGKASVEIAEALKNHFPTAGIEIQAAS